MQTLRSQVAEFRQIIDEHLNQDAQQPGPTHEMFVYGNRVERDGISLALYGGNERAWVASTYINRERHEGGDGRLIIQSDEGNTQGLERLWTGLGSVVSRSLVKPDELDAAVSWLRNPLNSKGQLDILTRLAPEELYEVATIRNGIMHVMRLQRPQLATPRGAYRRKYPASR